MAIEKTMIFQPESVAAPVKVQVLCQRCGNPMQSDPRRVGILKCSACGAVRRVAVPKLEPGCIVGKYKLLKVIGKGGMGALFLCCPLDDMTKRYAMKVQLSEYVSDSDAIRKRFDRESQLLSRLNHDCIVHVYDRWRDETGVFIVMEYINGETLEDLKESDAIFEEETVLEIGQIIADALCYAWDELKLIHRDIKPSNIMIDNEQQVRLLDFGIAKALGSGENSALTISNSGLGTPGYMSPEQFRDASNVGCTSDIYSLGATMYYLLTGRAPFTGDSAAKIFNQILQGPPESVQKLNPEVSDATAKLIADMLNADPAKRPSGWRKLLTDFENVLDGKMPLPN